MEKDTLKADIKTGGILSLGRFLKPYTVKTPYSTASVRGTIFYAHHEKEQAYHCTCQGHVAYTTANGNFEKKTEGHQAFFLDKDGKQSEGTLVLHSDDEITTLKTLLAKTDSKPAKP
jgi:hypothetical protein